MPRFVQMLERSGVFADQNLMIVLKGGFNLVYLRDAKGVTLKHDLRLDVQDVKFGDVERIAKEYFRIRSQGAAYADRLLALRTAMYGGIGPESTGRLLKVSAHGTGIPEMSATNGASVAKLDVAIMPRKEYTVAFRFLKHTTAPRLSVPVTKYTPANAQEWMNKLNWIFGAQANVYFRMIVADWIVLPTPAPQPMTFETFDKLLVPQKHGGAALTCFLVGKYKGSEHGADAAGSYSIPHKVCVLDDNPDSVIFDDSMYDAFTGVMAHEFTHFAGGYHHDRGRFLMSRGIETMEFDKQLVMQLNAW